MSYQLYDYTGDTQGALLATKDHVRGAARLAGSILSGDIKASPHGELFHPNLVNGDWPFREVTKILVKGPGIPDRLYAQEYRGTTFKFRQRCPGKDGRPCVSPEPWMHPTNKGSECCAACYTPSEEARQQLAERNRRLNPIKKPRSKKSKLLML